MFTFFPSFKEKDEEHKIFLSLMTNSLNSNLFQIRSENINVKACRSSGKSGQFGRAQNSLHKCNSGE